jgi:spore maturation protein CgeB
MTIMYLGDDFIHSTSAHRAEAFRRLGHRVTVINPRSFVPKGRWVSGLNVRTGFRFFAAWVSARVSTSIESSLQQPERDSGALVWVDGCPELPPSFYRRLMKRGLKIASYLIDDPFGGRDRRKWDLCVRSVPYHDLTVVVREPNVKEATLAGARRVMRVLMSYDPVAHAPRNLTEEDQRTWTSEVAFIGTWMPERGPFMRRLIELGVPLTIWGDRWHKAPEWEALKTCWRGPAIYGDDYVKAVQCAKVMIGMLSKGNRDLSTTRTMEVPFIGGAAFCAERTSEHERLFDEGREAFFWKSPEECARKAKSLLATRSLRERMVVAAQSRIRRHNVTNDAVLGLCLERMHS